MSDFHPPDAPGSRAALPTLVDWVVHRRVGQPRRRLACFPYAGGGAGVYRRWASEVADDVEVLALQLPGRENRLLDDPLVDLVQAARLAVDGLLGQPPLPTWFFGHSMGALMAYEAARVWQGPPLMGLAVSGRSAPHLGARVHPVCAMSDAVFIEYLSSIGGTPGEVLRQPELMALLMPMLRADFRMVDDYQPPASPLGLQCPMIAFYGVDDPATPADRMAAWSAYGAEGFRLEALPGGHFFLEPERAAILARMGLAA